MRRLFLFLLAGVPLAVSPAGAQDTLRLSALQAAAVDRDPRLRQVALEDSATALRLRNLGVERFPSFLLTGEATHVSEVAGIPIDVPGVDIPRPPKDRYEVALSADWLLYDGGVRRLRADLERARLAARRAELSARLYPLRVEVMEAYFAALLLQERLREVSALIEDLEARLAEVRGHVAAGTALPGDTAAVRAEVLRAMQQRGELAADRVAALAVLGRLTGVDVSGAAVLAIPELAAEMARADEPRTHPRFAVFEAERDRLAEEAALVRARSMPRLSAFGRYAYGRPGPRQFTDDPHDYWLAGLRVQWVPWDWGVVGRDAESLRIRRQILDTEEAAFSESLAREVRQPLETMRRLEAALELDAQIIALREQVERQARAQLAERAITAAAYVDARTALQESRIALIRHRAELARARARYLTTLGVPFP